MTSLTPESTCPGCGLHMPSSTTAAYDGYYNASPECWSVYTEVLAEEFGNAVHFGQAHQLTVDAYAVQHPAGSHPDNSIAVHLVGLRLVIERGPRPPYVPPYLQRWASAVEQWPHVPAPDRRSEITVFNVGPAGSPQEHAATAKRWAAEVWQAWSEHHAAIRAFAESRLSID